MQTNISVPPRRWERQPATIPISLVLKAENLTEDDSAGVIDFSLRGVGVLTAARAGSRREGKNRRQREIPGCHLNPRGLGAGG